MTRHVTTGQIGELAVQVRLCFERGMGGFSMDVSAGEETLYDSDTDARLFVWERAALGLPVGSLGWGELASRLAELCLVLPAGMLAELRLDLAEGRAPYVRVWA